MTFERLHGLVYNVGWRVFGIMATVAGIIALWSASSVWLSLTKPAPAGGGPGTQFVVGTVALLLGVMPCYGDRTARTKVMLLGGRDWREAMTTHAPSAESHDPGGPANTATLDATFNLRPAV